MALPEFLFRGVGKTRDERNGGKLRPKNADEPAETVFDRSGSVFRTRGEDPVDAGAVRSETLINTILKHQLRRQGYPSSFVSTTPSQENAEKYALHADDEGVVYKIKVACLTDAGVKAYEVEDYVPVPTVPEDQEVVLRASDGGTLPEEIITERIPVRRK